MAAPTVDELEMRMASMKVDLKVAQLENWKVDY